MRCAKININKQTNQIVNNKLFLNNYSFGAPKRTFHQQCKTNKTNTNNKLFSPSLFSGKQFMSFTLMRRKYSTEPTAPQPPSQTETIPKFQDKALNKALEITVEREKIPKPALILGGLGLLPLATGSVSTYFLGSSAAGLVVVYQMNYGILLLSFLGAVHWGLAMSKYSSIDTKEAIRILHPEKSAEETEALAKTQKIVTTSKQDAIRYFLSVLPFTYSWCLTGLAPNYALTGIMFGFSLQYIADAWADRKGLVPSWYMKLRTPLTIGVLACLGSTLFLLN